MSDFLEPTESVWPEPSHSLFTPPGDESAYSDLAWQRRLGLRGRLIGFRRAADIIYDKLVGDHNLTDLDTVIYPYAACWRHYLELQLKSLLVQLRIVTRKPSSPDKHHYIDRLWREAQPLLIEIAPDEADDIENVGRVVAELAEMDADGQGFRYAKSAKHDQTLASVDRINLTAFHQAMTGVANFLDGADVMLDDWVSIQHEIDRNSSATFECGW